MQNVNACPLEPLLGSFVPAREQAARHKLESRQDYNLRSMSSRTSTLEQFMIQLM
jgi:hypothetical protein